MRCVFLMKSVLKIPLSEQSQQEDPLCCPPPKQMPPPQGQEPSKGQRQPSHWHANHWCDSPSPPASGSCIKVPPTAATLLCLIAKPDLRSDLSSRLPPILRVWGGQKKWGGYTDVTRNTLFYTDSRCRGLFRIGTVYQKNQWKRLQENLDFAFENFNCLSVKIRRNFTWKWKTTKRFKEMGNLKLTQTVERFHTKQEKSDQCIYPRSRCKAWAFDFKLELCQLSFWTMLPSLSVSSAFPCQNESFGRKAGHYGCILRSRDVYLCPSSITRRLGVFFNCDQNRKGKMQNQCKTCFAQHRVSSVRREGPRVFLSRVVN